MKEITLISDVNEYRVKLGNLVRFHEMHVK